MGRYDKKADTLYKLYKFDVFFFSSSSCELPILFSWRVNFIRLNCECNSFCILRFNQLHYKLFHYTTFFFLDHYYYIGGLLWEHKIWSKRSNIRTKKTDKLLLLFFFFITKVIDVKLIMFDMYAFEKVFFLLTCTLYID